MSRMENLDGAMSQHSAAHQRRISAEGGMTDDDLFMRGGRLAQMFCVGFAFLAPSLMLWYTVL